MIIKKDEIVESNLNGHLDRYIAVPPHDKNTTDNQALSKAAASKIVIFPNDGRDSSYYDVFIPLDLLVVAMKPADDYAFLSDTAKAVLQLPGSHDLSDVVSHAINIGTSAVKKIEDVLASADELFNYDFVIPVHTKADRKYTMSVEINGSSKVTDVMDRDAIAKWIPGPWGEESDEDASIPATLFMCQRDKFTKGGKVDQTSKRTQASGHKQDDGMEWNIDGPQRAFMLSGTTACACLHDARDINTLISPSAYVRTDGAVNGAACAIGIKSIHVVYNEIPCDDPAIHRPRIDEHPQVPAQPHEEQPRPPAAPPQVARRRRRE